MTEAVYREIYERARENVEKMGAGNPYDILGPDLPGTETALAGFARFGLKMRLMLTDSRPTPNSIFSARSSKPPS